MVTVNTDIIKKDTGWHLPTQVAQYNEYGKVNQETCYAYSNLEFLKKRDNTCISMSGDGGVNNTHHSPIIYTYGYKFNIPENATITKIQVRQRRKCNTLQQKTEQGIKDRVIRLKIGASISDYGEGHNNSIEAKWSSKEVGLADYTVGNEDDSTVYQTWGLTVTPAMANSQNFGCVVQCTGKTSVMMQPVIDCIEMNITYTQLGTTTTTPDKTTENVVNPNQSIQTTSRVDKFYQPDTQEDHSNRMKTSQSIDYIYTPLTFYIRYMNNVLTNKNGVKYIEEAKHDKITITLEKLRFVDGSTKKTLPVMTLPESQEKTDIQRGYISILKKVDVYPTSVGNAKITIQGLKPRTNNDTTTTEIINITITESTTNTSNSLCTISNSSFNGCDATEGKAIYNYGKLKFEGITIAGATKTTKYLFDYDKYRDGEL